MERAWNQQNILNRCNLPKQMSINSFKQRIIMKQEKKMVISLKRMKNCGGLTAANRLCVWTNEYKVEHDI